MANHLHQIHTVVSLPQDQLLKEFIKCTDGICVTGPQIFGVREKTLLDNDNKATVFRRVYIHTRDSGELKNVGWILDNTSNQCSLCPTHFSAVSWKHHCRRCGLTICSKCSPHRVLLKGFEALKAQRVCNNCNPGNAKVVPLEDNSGWGQSVLEALKKKEYAAFEEKVAKDAVARSQSTASTVASQSFKPKPKTTKPTNLIAEMWSYGAVQVRQTSLAFVFQASRPDRSMVFFNVCTSIYVPLTDEGTDVNETEVLFFVAGPRGQADDGMDVYDIIVHPTVAVKSKATHAAVYKRKICEQVIMGMEELEVEGQFSILFVLPDDFPYKQRVVSESDVDTAELDRMHLKATGELNPCAESDVECFLITATIPSAAWFYYSSPRVATNRKLLTKPTSVVTSVWSRYNHIILKDSGMLAVSQANSGSLLAGCSKKLQERPPRVKLEVLTRQRLLSELRVEAQKEGVKSYVRHSITLTPTGGYAVVAPKACLALDDIKHVHVADGDHSEQDNKSTVSGVVDLGNSTKPAALPARPCVHINVLVHPIVDDLVAMGVVQTTPDAPPPILLSPPGSHKDHYDVLVQTNYIAEVQGRVGAAYESRVEQIIKDINRQYAADIDEEQFVLTVLDAKIAANVHSTRGNGLPSGVPDPQDTRVTFVLFEYAVDAHPLASSSRANSTTTGSSSSGSSSAAVRGLPKRDAKLASSASSLNNNDKKNSQNLELDQTQNGTRNPAVTATKVVKKGWISNQRTPSTEADVANWLNK